MPGTAIASQKPAENALVIANKEQLQLLKDTICKGASDAELKLFVEVSNRTRLNPFTRQIHAVKRWDASLKREAMSIQIGIDGFRLIAERTGQYEGQLGPHWCGEDGVWKDIWVSATPPVGARVGALKAGCREPFWGIALYREYCQFKQDGTPMAMWAKMAVNMLAKCAESLALRKAFPAELSGLYSEEEMGQTDPAKERRLAIFDLWKHMELTEQDLANCLNRNVRGIGSTFKTMPDAELELAGRYIAEAQEMRADVAAKTKQPPQADEPIDTDFADEAEPAESEAA